MTDSFNERWQSDWVTGSFWHVLNLATLLGICVLWRPTNAAVAYGAGGGGESWVDLVEVPGGEAAAAAAAAAAGAFSLGDEEEAPAKLS